MGIEMVIFDLNICVCRIHVICKMHNTVHLNESILSLIGAELLIRHYPLLLIIINSRQE